MTDDLTDSPIVIREQGRRGELTATVTATLGTSPYHGLTSATVHVLAVAQELAVRRA